MLEAEIVIPCFNEAENLENLFAECQNLVDASNNSMGFILINNGSTDTSKEYFAKFSGKNQYIRIIELPQNQGYGGGILAGLSVASAPITGWTHADLQTPLVDCLIAVREIQKGSDFVKGSRQGRKFSDRILSLGMQIFETILFRQKLEEINAQPTVFGKQILQQWSNPPSDFSLDLYALVMANRSSSQIKRITVNFLPRQHGHSKWNIGFRSRLKFIKRTLKYSFELRRILNENI
jgi:glycosyltransferase involved in cell wall biosynthesis